MLRGAPLVLLCFLVMANAAPNRNEKKVVEARVTLIEGRSALEDHQLHIETDGTTETFNLVKAEPAIAKGAKIITVDNDRDGTPVVSSEPLLTDSLFEDVEKRAVFKVRDGAVKGILSDDRSLVHSEGKHYVHHNARATYGNDYIIPDFIPETPNRSEPIDRQGTPVVEILAVGDYPFSMNFNTNQELGDYMAVYFQSVNMRYDGIATIRLVACLRILSPENEMYGTENGNIVTVQDILIGTNGIDASEYLAIIGEWPTLNPPALADLVDNDGNQQFDLIQGFTTRDIIYQGSSNVIGLAYLGVTCSRGINAGLNEDDGRSWSGLTVVAHEMGHNFNSPHDDGGTCAEFPTGFQFIMNPFIAFQGTNQFSFSDCTTNIMTTHLMNRDCVFSTDYVNSDGVCNYGGVSDTRDPVGTGMTMDETCRKRYDDTLATAFAASGFEQCESLFCRLSDGSILGSGQPLDNSICDLTDTTQGVCLDGVCVSA